MQEHPIMIGTWLRHGLSDRFGAVLGEDIPQTMLDLLQDKREQD